MTDIFIQADWMEKIFWITALVSTIFYVLRLLWMLISGSLDDQDTMPMDANSSNLAFEILSINSLTAFFMMFGWMGLAAYKQFNLSQAVSLLVAGVAGILSMLVIVYLFRIAGRLVSRGSQYSIQATIGNIATVYLTIPKGGKGKVQFSLADGIVRELDAVSKTNEQIDSFQMVVVKDVIDNHTVSVIKIAKEN